MVTLATMTSVDLAKLKKQQASFFCPTCNQQVIMKAGTRMVAHFAHRSTVNCPSYEGGEGWYHEKGKLLLYQWLVYQNIDVQLEAYIPSINQRPDLLLTINKKRIAIEYQCARMSIEQVTQRNKGYRSANITPIWILGETRLNRQTNNHIKMDQFTRQFIHQFSTTSPPALYYFCPQTLQFITIQDIHLTQASQAIGKFDIKSLNQIHLLHLFKQQRFTAFELYQLWRSEKRKFRLKPRHPFGKELSWHQWLYGKGTHLEYLPSIVHLPVSSQYLMKTSTWDWQSRIVIDLLAPLPTGGQVSIKSCESFLRKQILSTHHVPLIHAPENPITQYLRLLANLNIIKQESPHSFTKTNPIKFHKNIEESLKADEEMISFLTVNTSDKMQA